MSWRLAPEGRSAPDLSFDLKATCRKSDMDAPERALEVGFWSAGKRDLNWRLKGLRVERGAGECCWR
ncbi:MAG: hypothetical protein OXD29_02190 [Roseovarius sp.]|nr:hypothetical protein [Roseovarius sp.]